MRRLVILTFFVAAASCTMPRDRAGSMAGGASSSSSEEKSAREFIAFYEAAFRPLAAVSNEAQWVASTDVSDVHSAESVGAGKALSAFTGNVHVIETACSLLSRKSALSPLTVAALERILLAAAESPGTIPDVTARRVEVEAEQQRIQDGYAFRLLDDMGVPVKEMSANEIDDELRTSKDVEHRRRVWEASKAIGVPLRPGLEKLQDLRNRVARELGHESFFALQVADYGMSEAEMMADLAEILEEIRPLYAQIHCWAKHALAKRYGRPAPKLIPAHWLPNRWGQEWPGLVETIDLDGLFAGMTAESVVKQAEAFYVSMGFEKLPATFWKKSDLYPVPPGSERRKNSHASAWHIDLENDVRSLMSVEPNARWFETTHHELGHVYYYMSYARPEVPVLLREGANRSFHEGIGELISLAAGQEPYLREIGLLPPDTKPDELRWLLNEALKTIVFLPFSIGVMSHWERDFYAGLPPDRWNARWWEYAAQYQGMEPPAPRGEEFCDPATKTHVNDDPGQYYDYALATVLKHQLHEHIARKILRKSPRSCSYYGSREAGAFLARILSLGATRDWREVLREETGEDLSARALLDYYAPLLEFLRRENAGRDASF